MRRVLIAAVAMASLAACGGVDREGTKDEIIKQAEASGLKVDGDCVDKAMDKFSDDELKAIDKDLKNGGSSENAAALLADIGECLTP